MSIQSNLFRTAFAVLAFMLPCASQAQAIKTALPRHRDFTETCRWFGKVESPGKVDVITLKPALIDTVDVADGATVEKGTPLFTISDPVLSRRLAAATNNVATLQWRIADSASSGGADQGMLRDQLQSAKKEARFLSDALHLRSTTAGVFTHRTVAPGQMVRAGESLAQIIPMRHLRITAGLFPKDDTLLSGKKSTIQLADNTVVTGTVARVLPERTAEGATVIWIEGKAIDHELKPGETVSGTILLALHPAALAVPRTAIVRDEMERPYVFIQIANSYEKRAVRTGLEAEGQVEILSGIGEGDTVVTQGAYELFYRDFSKTYKVAD